MDLSTLWFLLIGLVLIIYAVLDGFDLGIGVVYLFLRNESWKESARNIVAPFWDGNQVWLILGGGAIFAAFPLVYATVFSGFYLAVMLLLVALLFRAISLELRAWSQTEGVKQFWGWCFGISSLLVALVLGVALGNVMFGVPIDGAHNYTGTFLQLFYPFPVLVGLTTVLTFILHGAFFLCIKTEDEGFRSTIQKRLPFIWLLWLTCYIITTLVGMTTAPYLFVDLPQKPLFWLPLLGLVISILWVRLSFAHPRRGFAGSSVQILFMMAMVGISLYPRLLPSSTDINYSLTIFNAASGSYTHQVMLWIVALGLPLAIVYKVILYATFRSPFAKRSNL